MIEINGIAAFEQLTIQQKMDIQKALQVKDRLYDFLKKQNGKKQEQPAHWEQCKSCHPVYPGWRWKEPERDDSDIHPSQIHKCLKFLWYSCSGFAGQLEENVDPQLRMIFDIGHAWHRTMQHYGKKGAWGKPEDYQDEVSIDPDATAADGSPLLPISERYWIRGHADALVKDIIWVPSFNDWVSIKVVHEYKTINSGNYSKLTKPKFEHKRQATIYSAVLDAPFVVYLYTNKDNCQTVDYPVAFDHTVWNEITGKIDEVQQYVKFEQPPPWEKTSAVLVPMDCMDCGFRKICNPPLKRNR